MCLALLLSCYGASGYYASDDYTYLSSILSLVQNGQFQASLGGVRYPLILPGAFVYYLTDSLILTTCFGVLYHPLLVLIAYRLGCLIDKRELGIVTACLVAVLPGYYLYSGTLLPDVTQSFWTALWLYFLIQVPSAPSLRQKSVFICAAGFCNGLAYLTKESGLLLTVPSTVFLFFSTPGSLLQRVRRVGMYGVAFASFFVLEILLIKILSGEWLWRLGVIGKEEHVNLYLQRMARQGYTVSQRIGYATLKLKSIFGAFILTLTGLAFLIYPFLKNRSWLVWGTAVWLFLYLTIGSTSLTQYLPPSIQERYYMPTLILASLVVAHCILSLLLTVTNHFSREGKEHSPHRIGILFLLTLIFLWGFQQALRVEEELGSIYRSRETRAFLSAMNFYEEELSPTPIILSSYLARRMRPVLDGSHSRLSSSLLSGENPPIRGKPFIFVRNASSGVEIPKFDWITPAANERVVSCTRTFSTARTRFADILERSRELLLLIRPREAHASSSYRDITLQLILPSVDSNTVTPYSKLWRCEPVLFAENSSEASSRSPMHDGGAN